MKKTAGVVCYFTKKGTVCIAYLHSQTNHKAMRSCTSFPRCMKMPAYHTAKHIGSTAASVFSEHKKREKKA